MLHYRRTRGCRTVSGEISFLRYAQLTSSPVDPATNPDSRRFDQYVSKDSSGGRRPPPGRSQADDGLGHDDREEEVDDDEEEWNGGVGFLIQVFPLRQTGTTLL